MNSLMNYSGVTLRQWEEKAHAACFEINQEVKSRAQNFFYMLMQAPDLQTFIDLINNGSDTLLFVLFSCATKCTDFFGKKIQNFRYLVENILNWELNGFTFIRQGMPPLQEYVTRTILHCLGVQLKSLYKLGQSQLFLWQFLSRLPDNQFKLYIIRSFIEAVEVIDYDMGYMKYRSMIYHFQDNIIPFACDTLLPFFYKTEQIFQVIELSQLHQRLKLTEDQTLQQQFNRKIALLTTDQEIKASYMLQLLKSIIQFRYNISYNEFQQEHVAQTSLISFPDKVIDKIVNGQFVKAFFFVIQHISALNIINKKLDHLLMSLNCLSRIMQSRLSGLQLEVKQLYILQSIKGINNVISKCIGSKNRKVLETILLCNSRLLSGCQLSFIKATSQKYEGSQQLYHNYLKNLTSIIIEIVKFEEITYENTLLTTALQLANQILLNFGCRDEENIQQQGLFFIHFQRATVEHYLNNLCTPKCLIPTNKLINISDNKLKITQLFENFKRLATYDYEYFFTKLQEKVNIFSSNMAQQLTILANIIFLLAETTQKQFLQRTPFLHQATGHDISVLARIVCKCTYLMKCYIETRSVYFRKEATYIDLASILYSQSMLSQFLSNFQGNSFIKIKQPIYLHIVSQKGNQPMLDVNKDARSQEIILQYLKVLFNFLQNCLIATKQDQVKMLYVLEAVQKVIMKFKWNCSRSVYLKSQIYTALEAFITQFFNKFNFIVSVRTRTAKILVTLNFDDALDEYKFKICKFIQIVKSQFLSCMLYDLIGAFEGIEALAICKYFYRTLKRQIDLKVLFGTLFQLASRQHNEVLFKDACRLIRVMVNNKGFKASSNCTTTYEIFSLVLPYLVWTINQVKKNVARQFDFWSDSLVEIIETMNSILNGTHINVFIMDSFTKIQIGNQPQPYSSVMKQFLCGIFEVISQIVPEKFREYPNLQLLILMFYNEVNRELLTFILQDNGEKLVLQFTLFHFKLLDLIIEYMKEVLSGIKLQQDSLIRAIDAARGFYSFAKNKSLYTHKTNLLQNLQRVFFAFSNTEASESKHEVLIFYTVSFILTNYKNNFTILKSIGRIMYWLSKIFRQTLINSIIKLKFSQYMVQQFEDILNKSQLSEDGFVEEFKNWVRRSDQY